RRDAEIDAPYGPVRQREKHSSGERTAEVLFLIIEGRAGIRNENVVVQGRLVGGLDEVPRPGVAAPTALNHGFVVAGRDVVGVLGDFEGFLARQDRVRAAVDDSLNRHVPVPDRTVADAGLVREPGRIGSRAIDAVVHGVVRYGAGPV